MQDLSSATRDRTRAPCSGSRALTTGPPGNSLIWLLVNTCTLVQISFILKNHPWAYKPSSERKGSQPQGYRGCGSLMGSATRGQCRHICCQTLDKAKRDLDREEGILPSFTSPTSSHAVGKFLMWVSLPKVKTEKQHRYEEVLGKEKNPGKVVKMSVILMGIKMQLSRYCGTVRTPRKCWRWIYLTEAVPANKAISF